MAVTEISWTQEVWNCVRGCRRVSPGCEHCYAETMAARLVRMGGYEWTDGAWQDDPAKKRTPASRATADRYKALVRIGKDGSARWTGKFAFDEEKLSEPLRRKAPTLYFVNSMSDLFGEGLSNEQIAAVFGVMASCPQHTFQCLTKRPARMVEWFKWIVGEGKELESSVGCAPPATSSAPGSACVFHAGEDVLGAKASIAAYNRAPWPLPNVWIGCSVERQEEADERIPLLLQCPAAVRWVSAEPLLGPVSFRMVGSDGQRAYDALTGHRRYDDGTPIDVVAGARLDWIVFGGESGHGARSCEVEWIRGGVQECKDTEVPAFVKQFGAYVVLHGGGQWGGKGEFQPIDYPGDSIVQSWRVMLDDKKGADPAEWPEDLRVREWPAGFTPPTSKAPKSKALPMVTP